MMHILRNFVRAADGSWTCITTTEYRFEDGTVAIRPGERFARGDKVKGVDIATMLDRALIEEMKKGPQQPKKGQP